MNRSLFNFHSLLLFISFFYYLYYKDIEIPSYIMGLGALWVFVFKPYELKMDIRRQILAKYTEAEKEALQRRQAEKELAL